MERPRRVRRRRTAAAALAVTAVCAAVLLAAGCGGSDGEGAATTGALTVTTPSTTGATTMPDANGGASTDPVMVKGDAAEIALLTGVRAAAHDGYDRVVFEFANVAPGYDVRYVTPPVRADGSGEPVAVTGKAILVVRMEPALDADLSKESAPPTYTGPTRLTPGTSAVRELVRTGGFESVLTWAAGLDERRPFTVTRLDSPPRVVVDIASS